MKECYELREFDTITYKEFYVGEPRYCVTSKRAFDELKDYIESFDLTDDEEDIRYFFRIGNNGISTRNYVGLIQLKSGIQFQILPKLELSMDDHNYNETKRIFQNMLKTMSNFNGKTFNNADIHTQKMNLYEVFIKMYLHQVNLIIRHGLRSDYISLEENVPFFKGKLIVAQNIKNNAAIKTRFYMKHDEFVVNRPENKIIKTALVKLQKLTTDSGNKRLISQELVAFEEVDVSTNYEKDFSRVIVGRNMQEYETLMNWSCIILYDYSFTTFAGNNNAISLLFPMDRLYEAYIAKKMHEVFEVYGWEISTQDSRFNLFNKPKMFSLRPDIVLTNPKLNKTVILDTKWKRLKNDSGKNYGISQQDMYQMYAYAKKYRTPEVWLLYPMTDEISKSKTINFKSFEITDDQSAILDVIVTVQFIDLGNINECLTELKHKIENKG